jgi:glyoxylase-like metal-dependent hydrolase (beta-lactamase superfamily II)
MKLGALEIIQIPAGEMNNFSYLLFCPATRQGLAVDPSLEPQRLLDAIEKHGVRLIWLVNTHGHRDHVAGNGLVLQRTGASLAAHPLALPHMDKALADGDVLMVGDTEVKILHTPGHTPADITLNPPGALLTGDTLFVTKVGRADMPGSDPAGLYASLQRLAAYPGETLVFPGHDYGPRNYSTIAFEKQHNPYLRCSDLASFIALRLG